MEATSSTCSLMNHCMNCSPRVIAELAGERCQAADLLGHTSLLFERQRHRLDHVREARPRGLHAGMTTSSPASRRYCTIIMA